MIVTGLGAHWPAKGHKMLLDTELTSLLSFQAGDPDGSGPTHPIPFISRFLLPFLQAGMSARYIHWKDSLLNG